MGAVGSAYDNALMESFWGRMQVELLNRKKWKTRIELATAIHDYIELSRNPRRRHSALGMRTPTEAEAAWAAGSDARPQLPALAYGSLQQQQPANHATHPSLTISNDNTNTAA
jgi:hypothetical protein